MLDHIRFGPGVGPNPVMRAQGGIRSLTPRDLGGGIRCGVHPRGNSGNANVIGEFQPKAMERTPHLGRDGRDAGLFLLAAEDRIPDDAMAGCQRGRRQALDLGIGSLVRLGACTWMGQALSGAPRAPGACVVCHYGRSAHLARTRFRARPPVRPSIFRSPTSCRDCENVRCAFEVVGDGGEEDLDNGFVTD